MGAKARLFVDTGVLYSGLSGAQRRATTSWRYDALVCSSQPAAARISIRRCYHRRTQPEHRERPTQQHSLRPPDRMRPPAIVRFGQRCRCNSAAADECASRLATISGFKRRRSRRLQASRWPSMRSCLVRTDAPTALTGLDPSPLLRPDFSASVPIP
jgi:hypothetical protein